MDGLVGGAADDADVAVLELDGQAGLGDGDRDGDGHGDGLVLVQAAEGDLLAGDVGTPVLEARSWTRIGSVDGRGGGPALWRRGCASGARRSAG
jgi:hypothetical protein